MLLLKRTIIQARKTLTGKMRERITLTAKMEVVDLPTRRNRRKRMIKSLHCKSSKTLRSTETKSFISKTSRRCKKRTWRWLATCHLKVSYKRNLELERIAKTQILERMLSHRTWGSQKSPRLNPDTREALNLVLPGQKSQTKTSKSSRWRSLQTLTPKKATFWMNTL